MNSRYKIIRHWDIVKIETAVDELLERGWKVHGSLFVVESGGKMLYVQSMLVSEAHAA